mmetsp:Transcript_2188/g.3065  ORF Transcript_2188/g.3065 Transcript_2188/m.3065 type:complete len:393 (-) Transcript_2188:144-1322(-)
MSFSLKVVRFLFLVILQISFQECKAFLSIIGPTPLSLSLHHLQQMSFKKYDKTQSPTKLYASSSSRTNTSTTTRTRTRTTTNTIMLDQFSKWFCGDFDNYHQVVQDRLHGLLPREGGGHEHIHCTLIPIPTMKYNTTTTTTTTFHEEEQSPPQIRNFLAAFYFDGTPQRIFRFRFYQVTLVTENETENDNDNHDSLSTTKLHMKLFTLIPELEGQMRQLATSPMEWPQLYHDYITTTWNNNKNNTNDNPDRIAIQELSGCDVEWTCQPDVIQHEYYIREKEIRRRQQEQQQEEEQEEEQESSMMDDAYHAIMVHGEALVDSQMVPGQKIRIRDQLSLWNNEFWIHDRGYDPDTGDYIYGNQKGIPYHLKRVTTIEQDNNDNDGIQGQKNSCG